MVFCPECGMEIKEKTAMHCPECGTKIIQTPKQSKPSRLDKYVKRTLKEPDAGGNYYSKRENEIVPTESNMATVQPRKRLLDRFTEGLLAYVIWFSITLILGIFLLLIIGAWTIIASPIIAAIIVYIIFRDENRSY